MSPTSTKKLPPPPVQAHGPVSFDDILAALESNGRKVEDDLLRRIYVFSERMHKDQTRRSGEPYLTHPLSVAYILAELKFDPICVAVGLLHDVLEDTLTNPDAVEAEFGPELAELVEAGTKIGRHEYVRRDEAQAETFREMILAP